MENRKQEPSQKQTALPAVQPTDDVGEIDLLELLFRLLAAWKFIICLALVGAICAGIYTTFFVTPLYQATSSIYVISRRDSAVNLSDLQIGTALAPDYIKAFQMWEVHEEVISNLNLPYSYNEMKNMLKVKNDSSTRILDITVTSPSPDEAAKISNEYARVVSQYIADTMSTEKPNIMSVALVPTAPVSPNRTKSVIMGFMLCALLACGLIALRFILDDKIKTTDDIRKYTGLPTLAVVPIEESAKSKNGKQRRTQPDRRRRNE